MNYIFFDVECANCLNGEGKVCSVGYVMTDESFSVLKKKDILINPDAIFLLGNARTGDGIKLAYPLYEFKRHDIFLKAYPVLKKIFERPDTMYFGFNVNVDAGYLSYSCHRYQLPDFQYRFFDIQRMERIFHQKKNDSGLDTLIQQYHLEEHVYHRSDEDALMTMEVFKALKDEMRLSVEEILEKYSDCQKDTEQLLELIKERKQKKHKKELGHQRREKFYEESSVVPDINLVDYYFYKKIFFFDFSVFMEDGDVLLSVKDEMLKKGAQFTKKPEEADYLVVLKDGYHVNFVDARPKGKYLCLNRLMAQLKKK